MNTVEELKTDGAGRRVTAGGYCNFGNRATCTVMIMKCLEKNVLAMLNWNQIKYKNIFDGFLVCMWIPYYGEIYKSCKQVGANCF